MKFITYSLSVSDWILCFWASIFNSKETFANSFFNLNSSSCSRKWKLSGQNNKVVMTLHSVEKKVSHTKTIWVWPRVSGTQCFVSSHLSTRYLKITSFCFNFISNSLTKLLTSCRFRSMASAIFSNWNSNPFLWTKKKH